jgi:hypothetical protein
MNEHLEHLKEIRTLMERSSKFLSLSGLSGVSSGIVALIAAFLVYFKKVELTGEKTPTGIFTLLPPIEAEEFRGFLLKTAALTLIFALLFGIYFTVKKAKKNKEEVWNKLSKQLLLNLSIPLVCGGIFVIGLIRHDLLWMAPSATLVFYGLALLNASKFTVRDVYFLGLFEICLGLISMFLTGYSLLFWALGFGVLHIFYGAIMYFKYEK